MWLYSCAIFVYYKKLVSFVCVSNHCDISIAGELDANRPVPFRLTPSIQHFLSPIGVAGPLHMNMVAIARCLVQVHHSLPSIIQAILRDQFIAWQKVSVGSGVCYHAHRLSMIWGQQWRVYKFRKGVNIRSPFAVNVWMLASCTYMYTCNRFN